MAIVRKLKRVSLEKDIKHSEVDCTYSIIDSLNGKFLQIDTYGSVNRKIPGKKSQSLRLAPDAIQQLKSILDSEF